MFFALQCAIAVLIMLVFGSLTYRNIRRTRALAEQQADRQLTKMVLMQIILVVISMIPFGIFTAYSLITAGVSKSIDQLTKEYFVLIILVLASYLYYIVIHRKLEEVKNNINHDVGERIFISYHVII
jgi:fumarate reductase subunit D